MLKPQSLGKVGRISLGKKNKYLEEIDRSLSQNTTTWDEYSIDLLNGHGSNLDVHQQMNG